MADYLLPEQAAVECGLSEEELQNFETLGVIRAIAKNGYRYYSARDCYRLRAIQHLMRDKGLPLAEARARVDGGVKRPAGATVVQKRRGHEYAH